MLNLAGPEPLSWESSDNATLRCVLAQTCPPAAGGRLHDALLRLLSDEDGYVRENVLDRLAQLNPADLPALLDRANAELPVGWTCISCGTKNVPSLSDHGCAKAGCFAAGPDVAKKIADLRESLTT